MKLSSISDILQSKKGQLELISDQVKDSKRSLRVIGKTIDQLDISKVVAQNVAQLTQEELQYRVSDIVTQALQSVFGDDYSFQVCFEIKRGKTEASMMFIKDGQEIDPMTASGGGVVDVASFALRLSCFLINNPRTDNVLLLDEPMKALSERYQGAMADFIATMSDKLGIQVIMITHVPAYEQGNIIKL